MNQKNPHIVEKKQKNVGNAQKQEGRGRNNFSKGTY
jgi:hypothetical protein